MSNGEIFEITIGLFKFQCTVLFLVLLIVALVFVTNENAMLKDRVRVLEARECSANTDEHTDKESLSVYIDKETVGAEVK